MMKRNRATGLVAAIWLATSAGAYAGVPRLLSYQAKNHFRETTTVCGPALLEPDRITATDRAAVCHTGVDADVHLVVLSRRA
jgi:hypothetical protein